MHYNKNVYICVIYTISITLINYLRILLYDILIDSLRQRTFVLACGLVFKYMLLHFDWPPLRVYTVKIVNVEYIIHSVNSTKLFLLT